MRGRRLFCASSLCSLLVVVPSAQAGKWQAVDRITGQTPVTVTLQEKPRTYFRVAPDSPLTLTVDGPVRLRLVSRAELPPGTNRAVSYRVKVVEGNKILKEHATESSAAESARRPDSDAVICKSRSLQVEIPGGSHRVTVSVTGSSLVLVRLLLASPKRDVAPMISITPVEAPRSVTVSEGEKLIPYYSVLPGKPVKFRVVGPTSLELSARLDFDTTMRGVQTYRLAISEGGRRLRRVEFKTTKAAAASYTDLKDRVASKMDRLVLPLGEGVHELSVELLEPGTGSAEVHARIPQPTVGNEE